MNMSDRGLVLMRPNQKSQPLDTFLNTDIIVVAFGGNRLKGIRKNLRVKSWQKSIKKYSTARRINHMMDGNHRS